MATVFRVTSYRRPNGKCPTRDALIEFELVSPRLRSAVHAGIERLQYSSNHNSGTLTTHVSAGLWCMNIIHRGRLARLFFIFKKGARIYLLNGCTTKINEQIPGTDLFKAIKLAKEAKSYA